MPEAAGHMTIQAMGEMRTRETTSAKTVGAGEMRMVEMSAEMAATEMATAEVPEVSASEVSAKMATAEMAAPEVTTATTMAESKGVGRKHCGEAKSCCQAKQFGGSARHLSLQSPANIG
jgi:hypothetical protein